MRYFNSKKDQIVKLIIILNNLIILNIFSYKIHNLKLPIFALIKKKQ